LKLRERSGDVLRIHTKTSLLVARWIGLPLGWISFLTGGIVYLTVGIHDDTAPGPILMLIPVCLLVLALVLGVFHRAVTRELGKRQDEPTQFWRTLGRMMLLIVLGLLVFLAVFLGSQFALSRTTSMKDERILDISAFISLTFLLIAFSVLALRWTLSVAHKPPIEHGAAEPQPKNPESRSQKPE
jgi:uncharacterized membrane protein HdeD (DUF308 family)